MARVLPRKKKTTVADPQDAWGILKDMRRQDDRQIHRQRNESPIQSFLSLIIINPNYFQDFFIKADE